MNVTENDRLVKVIEKLKELKKVKSDTDIADSLNVSRSTISDIVNKKRGVSKNFLIKFANEFNVNKNYILSGESPLFLTTQEDSPIVETARERAYKYRMSLKEKRNPVPMYNTKAAAGTIALVQDEPELILEFVDMPFVGMVDGAIEVVGDSMSPSFKNGARAAVRKLEDKTLLAWGEVYYIIDSNYEGYVKRVYEGQDESHIVLRSDNPDKEMYPAFKRKWENIVAIFKVKADITKH